jgi:hypothetical protein
MTEKNVMFPALVAQLNPARREAYEERAGVREFDGGLPREYAECAALLDLVALDALAFSGVSLLRVQQGPVTRFVLVADQRGGETPSVDAVTDLRSAVLWVGGVAEICPSQDVHPLG